MDGAEVGRKPLLPIDSRKMTGVWILTILLSVGLIIAYLVRVNHLMKGVPPEVQQLTGPPWTPDQLRRTYRELERQPVSYNEKTPPKQERRYIVTGGNGLVGGHIVLQLLARGTPTDNIRIIDVRKPERSDLLTGPAVEIDFVQTDIRSRAAVDAAFNKPWPTPVAALPLTVFHTAAVILAADRSKYLYSFPYDVNVKGTENMLAAARNAGADVFSSTSSASISLLPVNPWVSFWAKEPDNFWQVLDEIDFSQPLKAHEEYFGNYPASKAAAERRVCDANSNDFRTGCIRPANGVYGNPTDNTVGQPLSKAVMPTWAPHICQSLVHGANVAIAHLQHEAILLSEKHVDQIPQAGRPFVVTDPNPPITYNDLYVAISTLSIHPFRAQILQPVVVLCLSYVIEWLQIAPHRFPWLKMILPEIKGDARSLQPRIFTICTHIIGSDAEARKAVSEGGLGYTGVITTLEGIVSEIVEWNREHGAEDQSDAALVGGSKSERPRKRYTASVSYADQLKQAIGVGEDIN